jgi:hypothetical protein
MKEKPILFSAPMVRAILDDRKTMTRRVVKLTDSGRVKAIGSPRNWHIDDPNAVLACPYGAAFDQLWVKETHYRYGKWIKNGISATGRQKWRFKPLTAEVFFCDNPPEQRRVNNKYRKAAWYKRPSIFMPRWASRITLMIKAVRVERLQDISDNDIIAEGVYIPINKDSIKDGKGHPLIRLTGDYPPIKYLPKHDGEGWSESELLRAEFAALWDSINAKRDDGRYAWKNNPFVWVLGFRRI